MSNQLSPNRKSIRLPNWDYRSPGSYFITFCTAGKIHYFNRKILYKIAEKYIISIPDRHPHAEIDSYSINPDHIHLILTIVIPPPSCNEKFFPLKGKNTKKSNYRLPGSIGSIIQGYKNVTKRVIRYRKDFECFDWQRGFWDHVIKNKREYYLIMKYIDKNIEELMGKLNKNL